MLIFQFTLPREERRQVQAQPLTLQNFNPRSHERSDHITQSFVFRFFNFNPRSHERSDYYESNDNVKLKISIHAPTRGATPSRSLTMSPISISIHAPTRGATLSNDVKSSIRYFNPRSHERSDHMSFVKSARHINRFQSTLPREERLIFFQVKTCANTFQSTLPREERLYSIFNLRCFVYFNPRSHERSDITFVHISNLLANFNPRSHERSDARLITILYSSSISIHAPTRGATACLL